MAGPNARPAGVPLSVVGVLLARRMQGVAAPVATMTDDGARSRAPGGPDGAGRPRVDAVGRLPRTYKRGVGGGVELPPRTDDEDQVQAVIRPSRQTEGDQ